MTDESLTSLARRVPDLLDYSLGNSYIDYNQNIDNQLFALFGLTVDEISHVKRRVESMR